MNTTQIVTILPLIIALVSVTVTGFLGYGNYRLAKDKSDLERERLAHDKAMIFWDKRVDVYSKVWSAIADAHDEYLALRPLADNPLEELRKWTVIKMVNSGSKPDAPEGLDLAEKVTEDPDGWLPWLMSERRVDPVALESEVRKSYFFLTPEHRQLTAQIFDLCIRLKNPSSVNDFNKKYYAGLNTVKNNYVRLRAQIDETFHPTSEAEPSNEANTRS